MKKIILTPFLFCLLFLSSCYKDNFRELHPAVATNLCDTLNPITYTKHIAPIITQFCINCHGVGDGRGDLHNYTELKLRISTLYNRVAWLGPQRNMPDGASTKIPDCNITQIKKWVAAGAPEN
jgi:hypothetical protein